MEALYFFSTFCKPKTAPKSKAYSFFLNVKAAFLFHRNLRGYFLSLNVTKQTRVGLHGTLTHDPTISVEGNSFLLTGFQPWGEGAESTPAKGPPLPQDPALPLFSKRLQAKTMPRSSPYLYLFLSLLRRKTSILSGMCTCGFLSHHPLTASSPSGPGVCCS